MDVTGKQYLVRFTQGTSFAHWFICECQNSRFLANVLIGDKVHIFMNSTVTTFVIFECMHQILRLIKKEMHQKVTV